MKQEDIIRMALEAKLPVNHPDWADAARRFAELVRADERVWVGLTDEEVIEISHLALTRVQAVQMTEAKLKAMQA
jgi:hypothetical protein